MFDRAFFRQNAVDFLSGAPKRSLIFFGLFDLAY